MNTVRLYVEGGFLAGGHVLATGSPEELSRDHRNGMGPYLRHILSIGSE